MWDANVRLIEYTTVEMHKSYQVLRQFGTTRTGRRSTRNTSGLGRRIKSILVYEPFSSTDTVIADNYLTWFRAFSKPYLLPLEAKSRQIWYIFQGSNVPCILHPHVVVDVKPHVGTDIYVFTATNGNTDADAHAIVDVNVQYLFNVPGIWCTLWL
ncbi:hypothetical protein Goshw_002506 [Gossypium schwendimanii]|uniref:Uncharacterized protein n=1 Tax=Gossypium schwendimanii TaxID=34291 RepID=A0A7J9L0J8_GOSSC|nr:hypothetical protein [Gossypium schwendimanii]